MNRMIMPVFLAHCLLSAWQCITCLFFIVSGLVFTASRSFCQSTDWRLGFEYNELPPPFTSEASHDTLLSRLAFVLNAQQTGSINVNGNGWAAMQPNESSPINFNEADGWIKRFQDANFEMLFYLTPNTAWSQTDNSSCIDGPGDDECAPDTNHLQQWLDYVKAVVERYDGDGVNDLPGLVKPVHFYVMPQEVSFSGGGGGDADDANGVSFWDDNMQHLIELHRLTYESIQDADPTGNSKLVGSGGWFFDLYSDFPDYPAIEGPTVQARLNGQNLFGSIYQKAFDSLKVLLLGLSDTTGGIKCDYIGWHPHSGWKATDQSFKFIKTYAPSLPIFVDDMWSAILTSWNGLFFTLKDGYCQFIGGDSIEGDFPNASIASYQELFNGLESGDAGITNWYNAKTSREAVKCIATAFGEGAERVHFSLANDINPDNILLYFASQPYRYTGMVERKDNGFAPKPVMYTLRLLADKLQHFTSVEKLSISNNPKTRIYKFILPDDKVCLIAWSEAGWNTETPEIANGETVLIPVNDDTVNVSHLVTLPGITIPTVSSIVASNGFISMQLGFEPILIEDHATAPTGLTILQKNALQLKAFPNPVADVVTIQYDHPKGMNVSLQLFNLFGRKVAEQMLPDVLKGEQMTELDLSMLPDGIYLLQVITTSSAGNIIIEKKGIHR